MFIHFILFAFWPVQSLINISTSGSDSATCNSGSCRTFNYAFLTFTPNLSEEYSFDSGAYSEKATNISCLILFFFFFFCNFISQLKTLLYLV
jgi:hypothetical protein